MTDDRRYWLVSLMLSVVGGFTDAGSFVLAHSFTGHITGNSILLAIALAGGRWGEVAICLVAIAAFLAGTATGAGWPVAPHHSACRRLAGPILVETLLIAFGLACSALPSPAGRVALLACLCLALGVQNGALGKIASVPFHTTFITGLSTSLVTSLVAGKPDAKRRVLPPIIACFLVGAFLGAFTVSHFGAARFTVVLAPLVITWLLALSAPSQPLHDPCSSTPLLPR